MRRGWIVSPRRSMANSSAIFVARVSSLHHPPRLDQPLGAFTVNLGPSALWSSWREMGLEEKVIQTAKLSINPTVRERDVYGIRLADCCLWRAFLREL
jgi:hypothetical protein